LPVVYLLVRCQPSWLEQYITLPVYWLFVFLSESSVVLSCRARYGLLGSSISLSSELPMPSLAVSETPVAVSLILSCQPSIILYGVMVFQSPRLGEFPSSFPESSSFRRLSCFYSYALTAQPASGLNAKQPLKITCTSTASVIPLPLSQERLTVPTITTTNQWRVPTLTKRRKRKRTTMPIMKPTYQSSK